MVPERTVLAVSAGLIVISVALALAFGDYQPSLWVPGIVTNLLTTAIAILAINSLVAGQEKERRRRRSRNHQLFAAGRTFYPSLSCLRAAEDIASQALRGSLPDLLRFIERHEAQYRDDLRFVRDKMDVYGRFLSVKQLQALEGMLSGLDGLLRGYKSTSPIITEELQEMGICGCLEGIEKDSREFVWMMNIPNGTQIADTCQRVL